MSIQEKSMKNIKEIYSLVEEYDKRGNYEKELEVEIREAIQSLSKKERQEKFIEEFREIYTLEKHVSIDFIYEAICLDERKDLSNWEEFFIKEYDRTFYKADKDNMPDLLIELFVIGLYIDDHNERLNKEMIKICAKYLRSKNDKVKRYAIEYVEDWILEIKDKSEFHPLLRDIQKLLKDKNKKIRKQSYLTLKELNYLPKKFRLGIIDRILFKFE